MLAGTCELEGVTGTWELSRLPWNEVPRIDAGAGAKVLEELLAPVVAVLVPLLAVSGSLYPSAIKNNLSIIRKNLLFRDYEIISVINNHCFQMFNYSTLRIEFMIQKF